MQFSLSVHMYILYAIASGTVFKRYDPAKTCFKSIYKINPYLLQDIVNCYKKAKTVCRVCYYRKQVQEPFYSNRQCKGCKKIAQPLIMIPASKMCENLAGNKIIPIPPPPKNRMSPCNRYLLMLAIFNSIVKPHPLKIRPSLYIGPLQ